MRKHLLAILLPILVATFAFIAFNFIGYSSNFKSEEFNCHSDSKQECLLENRRKSFSQQWQMDSWKKSNLFSF